jgi:hypothetical protein
MKQHIQFLPTEDYIQVSKPLNLHWKFLHQNSKEYRINKQYTLSNCSGTRKRKGQTYLVNYHYPDTFVVSNITYGTTTASIKYSEKEFQHQFKL